jgi:hypothetical protein
MRPVRVVQVPIHQVIDMVPVWNPVVAAVRGVHMVLWVLIAVMLRCTVRGVRCAYRQNMVINMVAVPDSGMAAARSMLMAVPFVHVTVLLSNPALLPVSEPSTTF